MKNYPLTEVVSHMRHRAYMSGVDRDHSRIKRNAEVFTPTPLVQEMLDRLPKDSFTGPKTFLDPTCGDSQFLSEVVIRKMENGQTYQAALATVYGADLMMDNCVASIKRLFMVTDDQQMVFRGFKVLTGNDIPRDWRRDGLLAVFEIDGKICNIVQADGLKYDYSFGEKEQFSDNSPLTDNDQPLFEFE